MMKSLNYKQWQQMLIGCQLAYMVGCLSKGVSFFFAMDMCPKFWRRGCKPESPESWLIHASSATATWASGGLWNLPRETTRLRRPKAARATTPSPPRAPRRCIYIFDWDTSYGEQQVKAPAARASTRLHLVLNRWIVVSCVCKRCERRSKWSG
jgi:hypothetical protein